MKLMKTLVFGVMFLSIGVRAAEVNGQHFQKVMYVIFENTDYDPTIQQSYFKKFAESGVLFTNFSAETHPSQPNYISMIAGSSLGITGDGDASINQMSIVDLLEAKGVSWKVYLEGFPGNCFTGSTGTYVRKHNPFMSFVNIQSNPERCSHLVSADELESDIAQNKVPQYSFYVPNMENDGHDTSVTVSNAWFENKFDPLIANQEFMHDLLLVATFDEGGWFGPNHIYTAMIGSSVVPGSVVSDQLNHTSLIRMIEDNFGLDSLNQGDSTSLPLQGFWK
jgi:hypothetical protein